uniref:choline transporter-like protein 2 isoform X2 n=1 Tax=Myxine glutinosa TaxID=7769 RepID=UPI003590272B
MADDFGPPCKFDPSFRGPIKKRSCTDIICCIFFLLFIVVYVFVGIVAWTHGDPRQVLHPIDSYGKYCGQEKNADKPFLLYFNILKCVNPAVLLNLQCPTHQICVKECPKKSHTLIGAQKNNFKNYQKYCTPDFKPELHTPISEILSKDLCPSAVISSKPFMNRCFPNLVTDKGKVTISGNETVMYNHELVNVTDIQNAAKQAVLGWLPRPIVNSQSSHGGVTKFIDARRVGMKIFEDFSKSWYWVILGLVIALILSLFFLILLRFLAGVLVWIVIVGVIGVIGYGIFHCFWEYQVKLKGRPGADNKITDIGFQTDFRVYLQLRDTWLAFMILLCILEVIIILMLIFLRNRILIAIGIIRESSRAVAKVMSSLLYPLVTFVLLSVCVFYWAITSLYLATSGVPVYKVFVPPGPASKYEDCKQYNSTVCDLKDFKDSEVHRACHAARCLFVSFGGEGLYHQSIFWLQIYNIFAFLWIMNFVIALGHCTLAGAFASYYWAFNKPKDIPPMPIFTAFSRALRYHVGSLAFGSFILAIVQLIRVLLEYIDHRLHVSENKVAKFIMCCLKCCFWCLEKFVKFLNRNAYIMVAIYGTNFCRSAKNAFCLLMRNVVRVVVIDLVTDFLLMLGKLLVVGSVGILAFFFFTGKISIGQHTPSLNYYWVPILTVVIGSYMIAHGFFSVYNMCIDTLFLCFLEDLERNDGSEEHPYYMSKSLMKLLKKKNKN